MLLNIYSHRLRGDQVQRTIQRVCSETLGRNPRHPGRATPGNGPAGQPRTQARLPRTQGQLVDPGHGLGSPELRVSLPCDWPWESHTQGLWVQPCLKHPRGLAAYSSPYKSPWGEGSLRTGGETLCLAELSQTQEPGQWVILLYEVVRTGRFMDTESRTDCQVQEKGTEGLLFNGKGRVVGTQHCKCA